VNLQQLDIRVLWLISSVSLICSFICLSVVLSLSRQARKNLDKNIDLLNKGVEMAQSTQSMVIGTQKLFDAYLKAKKDDDKKNAAANNARTGL
jgi:hypothetical protein